MKRTIITVVLALAFSAFAIQAVEQTAFSGAGIIESTTGGFKFPDGTVLTSAESGKPWGVAWVSQGGGDYDDPNQAMGDIDTWCPDRSQSSPCLIRMAPGTWTMGDTPIVLLSDVHIQGSGGTQVPGYSQTALTIIKGTVTGSNTGVIVSRDGGSLRDLVVINESSGSYGIAIYVQGGSHFYIKDIQALARNATTVAYGLRMESTASVQTVVWAYNSRFEGGFGNAANARGVYMYGSTGDNFVQFICRSCELHASAPSSAYGLLMGAGGSASAAIEHSNAGLIASSGTGSRYISVQYSTISEMALNDGTSKSCLFIRAGGVAYTDTCP